MIKNHHSQCKPHQSESTTAAVVAEFVLKLCRKASYLIGKLPGGSVDIPLN
jgi:hypothetical protein